MGHAIGTDTTYTGNPVSFNAVNGGTMKSISVPLTYSQDLHGYDHPWGPGGGVNLFDVDSAEWFNGIGSSGNQKKYGHAFTAPGTYALKLYGTSNTSRPQYFIKYADNTWLDATTISTGKIVTIASGDTMYVIWGGYTPSNTEAYRAQAIASFNEWKVQVALSSTQPSQWYPYSNVCPIIGLTGLSVYVGPTQDPDDATEYVSDWSAQGTVYSGSVDVVGGELTVDMLNIPSYNGETINEPWLSSMDEYTPGATPTTGAQVVYTLTTPITYQLTPKSIDALIGQNYIWSSNNQTLSAVLTAPAAGFAGWLIKCVTNGTPVEIPLKYMRAETYTVTPDQRMEWSAERDVTGVLHRETVQNLPPKIEFNTPLMTNSDINALNSIIKAAFTSYLQRNITIQFYDPERDEYWEWDCYMPDVKYHIRNADTANNIINYEELRYAFIGY